MPAMPTQLSPLHKRMIPLVISFALFMEGLDTTIINTAIPAMSHSLNVNPIDLKIALISYLLSLAIFIPISGWLADKFGAKRVFIFSVIVFTASSVLCGFAHNLSALIIARIIQGFGGALTLPIGRLIIMRTFGRHELINTMNQVIMISALGILFGPVLGGIITHYFSWPWIFWVNIPVGLVTIFLAKRYLIYSAPVKVHPLDKLGLISFGGSLAAFTFALSAFSESAISSILIWGILFSALLLFFWYTWHSRQRSNPIVKTELLRLRTFKISVIGNLFARIGLGGIPFLVPLLLQIGLGYPAQIAGLLLAPTAIGVLLAKPFSLFLLRFFGYKQFLLLNTSLLGVCIFLFFFIAAHTPFYLICALTFLFGFLSSLQYGAMNSLAYAEVPTEDFSAATSIMGILQQLALSFGVAISALLIRHFSVGPPDAVLTIRVFHDTFLAVGMITLLSSTIFICLKREDGYQMIQKEKSL
jgi:EmrB/QacA subfamily drug resistance transporter